jgi:RNA polymerase sigma-70 factor (sigma-E family)
VIPAEEISPADMVVTVLYQTQYRSLVRLAALLVRDAEAAEEVVQDAFIATHRSWSKLASLEQAESYLRRAVVNRCRSVQLQRSVMGRYAPGAGEQFPDALIHHGRADLVEALRELPARQREALVLRYYADMSEAQIAECMGISRQAVKVHTAKAMSALRRAAERDDWTDCYLSPQPRSRPDTDINHETGHELA